MFGAYGSRNTAAFQVILDDGEPADSDSSEPGADQGPVLLFHVIYASPSLDNTNHKIVFRNLMGVFIDYATVGVENDTPLLGHNVMVGSDNPGIQYQGSWFRNSSTLTHKGGISRRPFGNSTAQTGSKPPSSFQFQFYGTFISVIGVSPVTDCQSFWTFDGQGHIGEHRGALAANISFEWFSMNSALPENHTLTFNGIDGALFTLDYINYMPSTSTLETQPSSTNIPGSMSSSPAATQTTTKRRLSNAGIAGAVIGATAGLAATLLVLIILMHIKRRVKWARMESIKQVDPYPIPELPPSDMTEHKSFIPGVSIGEAREGSIEAHYALPNCSDGIEHHSTFQRIMGVITRRNGPACGKPASPQAHEMLMDHTVEPFRSFSYPVGQSILRAHHKPSVSDAHNSPTINQRIQVIEAQDVGEDVDDATSMTATVVAQDGDTRSHAEHLQHLMAEIQR
ncbi:hypothetical protein DXG01_005470, partial [Tephrocybe rancida]